MSAIFPKGWGRQDLFSVKPCGRGLFPVLAERARGSSSLHLNKPCLTISYQLHQCRPCTLRAVSRVVKVQKSKLLAQL